MSDERHLLACLSAQPIGYSEGCYDGGRWSATVKVSADSRRWWLWAEELGGADRVSANVFVLADGRVLLKPCEMASGKVEDFISGYAADVPDKEGRPE